MRRLALLLLLLVGPYRPALAAAVSRCVAATDTATSLELPAPLKATSGHRNEEVSGAFAGGSVWAAVRGPVSMPVPALVEALRTQEARKSDEDSGMGIVDIVDTGFLARQKVSFAFTPVPFYQIAWTEEWAYTLRGGTPAAPTEVMVAYRKTDGTRHISHLCGNVLLRALDANTSQVTLYEEIKAYRRSQRKTLDGIRATLQKLQASAPGVSG